MIWIFLFIKNKLYSHRALVPLDRQLSNVIGVFFIVLAFSMRFEVRLVIANVNTLE